MLSVSILEDKDRKGIQDCHLLIKENGKVKTIISFEEVKAILLFLKE